MSTKKIREKYGTVARYHRMKCEGVERWSERVKLAYLYNILAPNSGREGYGRLGAFIVAQLKRDGVWDKRGAI